MSWQLLLHEIRVHKLDLARLDPRAGMPVLPPAGASPQALAAVERRWGRALPPSYRAMLACHDGVPQLYHGAGLLGARPLARGSYDGLARLVIAAPNLIPFGVDGTGETLFAWDMGREQANGEIEVVVWVNEIGVRVESFPAFLELVRDLWAAELEDRRRACPPSSRPRAHLSMPSILRASAA